MPESTCSPVPYPDGSHVYFPPSSPGPVVQARFADGGLVEFHPASEWAWQRIARVRFHGVKVKDQILDIDADIAADGNWIRFQAWKTDVAGADGGMDIPANVRQSALALCRKRAQEARDAVGVTSGRRRPANLTS